MAAVTVASAGEGVGNEALPVIPSTTLLAYVMRMVMRLGRSRTAKLLWALLVEVGQMNEASEWLRDTAVSKLKEVEVCGSSPSTTASIAATLASASRRSTMAAITVASAGSGTGKAGLAVIAFTTPVA